MVVPLVLYGFLVLTKVNERSGRPPIVPDQVPGEPSGEDLIAAENTGDEREEKPDEH